MRSSPKGGALPHVTLSKWKLCICDLVSCPVMRCHECVLGIEGGNYLIASLDSCSVWVIFDMTAAAFAVGGY